METLDKQLISVHHIGGRGESDIFPVPKAFEGDVVKVLYDADSDCLPQTHEINKRDGSMLLTLPYCLSDSSKPATFNINFNPNTSSLYKPNPDMGSFCVYDGNIDSIWSEDTKSVEERKIDVVTLDEILSSTKVQAPPPDLLSIDAQGAAYDILAGAKNTIRKSVLAVVIETEFQPLYKGQKLFGDNLNLLSEQGFQFARFLTLYSGVPKRAPIGLRGRGFHAFADALFLRRIDDIEKAHDKGTSSTMLRKLGFISLIFKQYEYALECLDRSSKSMKNEGSPVYLKFLNDLEAKIGNMKKIFPRTSISKYAAGSEGSSKIKNMIKGNKGMFLLLRAIKRSAEKGIFFVKYIASFLKSKIFGRYSGVEKVLIKYGLKSQAKTLRDKRETFRAAQTYADVTW